MSRQHIAFPCADAALIGTLDSGGATAGLLIVTGGNEIRSGAFSGQAKLAADIAASGFPVFRFDRRGVGDSSGENRGFRASGDDISAAIAEFRQSCPSLKRIIAFGNCDAASALMLNGGANCDALVLANPWTFEDDAADDMPPEAVRARYLSKLKDPREALRLLRGGVSLGKLVSGIRTALKPNAPPSGLADDMRVAMAPCSGLTTYLIAGRDRTGKAFQSAWPEADNIRVRAQADHAFSAKDDSAWLTEQILSVLHEQAG